MSCAALPTGNGFLAAALAHFDCQAQTIGASGYQALASPGSPVALAVTAMLTIFVAIVGIRFLMGRSIGASDLIGGTIKIGFVLALASNWPAYRTVVYNVVLKGPSEVAGSIGRAASLPASDGGLAARLQGVDNGIMALVKAGSGKFDANGQMAVNIVVPPLSDDTSLGLGKTLFVSSILGSFGLLRLAGGVFLALAPLFAGFMLFEATRFLFFGWLRSLIAVAIGSVGTAIVLGVELAIIEPWLSQVLALRSQNAATLSAPFELLTLTLSFALIMFGMLALAVRISFASSVMARVEANMADTARTLKYEAATWQSSTTRPDGGLAERTRAQDVAQSLVQSLNREATAGIASNSRDGTPSRSVYINGPQNVQKIDDFTPLGRNYPTPVRRLNSHNLKRKAA